MYQRMLVPLDGSELAETVFPYVSELAVKLESEVHLVSVVEPGRSSGRLFTAYLDKMATDLKGDQVRAQGVVLYGDPAREILDYAKQKEIDLIVMAPHGYSVTSRAVMGSVANVVLHSAKAPFLIVSSRRPEEAEKVAEEVAIRKVLVPLDGSELGETALPYARELARRMDAEILLFQVATPTYAGISTPDQLFALGQMGLSAEATANEYLQRVEQEIKSAGVKARSAVSLGMGAAVQILKQAKDEKVDLIAMSSRGRTGLSRWVHGSTTEKVLHATEVPILLVRARENTKPSGQS